MTVKDVGDVSLIKAFTRHWDIVKPNRNLLELIAERHPARSGGQALCSAPHDGAGGGPVAMDRRWRLFFVCGDASWMGRDVDATLKAIIERFGAITADRATDYVAQMQQEKRYVRDVY